jgi:acid stress chaperone HdeB
MRAVHVIVISCLYLFATPTEAQTINLENLRCDQWLATGPQNMTQAVLWLDGYKKGPGDSASIDFDKIGTDANALSAFCRQNGSTMVAAAARTTAGLAQFGCDGSGSQVCYFKMFPSATAASNRSFVMGAGQREMITGVHHGSDVYCVCIDRQAPAAYAQCSVTQAGWCKAQVLKNSLNN